MIKIKIESDLPGTGKTWMAIAISKLLSDNGFSVKLLTDTDSISVEKRSVNLKPLQYIVNKNVIIQDGSDHHSFVSEIKF